MSHATIRVLAVEDDPVQVLSLQLTMRSLGYELVGTAPTAARPAPAGAAPTRRPPASRT